jgi:hypothetical protein
MTSQLDIILYGHSIANLIRKHGGWLDENDQDVVRFPTPHAKAKFEEELDAKRRKENDGQVTR